MPSTQPTNLFSLARSKLHFSVGSKDNCSLHRWVLLKNSIIRSTPSIATATTTADSGSNIVNSVYSVDGGDYDDEEEEEEEEEDSFMFPDAQKFADVQESHHNTSESEWLDSLLETLGSDDDDDEFTAHTPADDDEDHALSPSISPFSSSDDLSNPHSQSPYYPPPTVPVSYSYPYLVPYPPFHPPLVHSYHVDHDVDDYASSLTSPLSIPLPPPPTYDDPLPYPYHHLDDVEDLSVPDAIEDTSDDESDVPPTPSLIHSPCSESALSLVVDPASIPLPGDHRRRRQGPSPQVYIGTDDSYFHPFEFDPLPFHDDLHHTYNTYQEC